MTQHQAGIFDKRYRDHLLLEYRWAPSGDVAALRSALCTVLAARDAAAERSFVLVGFGPRLLAALGGTHSFDDFDLDGLVPSTQGELWIWVQAADRGTAFDLGRSVHGALASLCDLTLEVDAFVYHDLRDLMGFVDGIGNPEGERGRQAALIPAGQPGAGGSYVFTQKWRHNLDAFAKLSVAQQENVFGRTKVDAVEFDDERMPDDAHVGRTDVDRDGVPQKIWRRSVPYGGVREHGLYFLAFSCELSRFDYLLRRMYGVADDNVRDHMLSFTEPQTGAYWFLPAEAELAALLQS